MHLRLTLSFLGVMVVLLILVTQVTAAPTTP